MKKIEIIGIEGLPEIKENDDLVGIILDKIKSENIELQDNDIIVISQKIISKWEGRIVNLNNVIPSQKAIILSKITQKDPRFVELVLRESKRIVKATAGHLIVETKHGIVCANAGIDRSNVKGGEYVTLLPEDPDKSARIIRNEIEKKTGKKVGIIISDTYGRPLREGQINLAIGASGVKIFKDYRGKADRAGYILQVKNIAIADELASAAELVMGQGDEGIPVAIIRGLNILTNEDEDASKLNMPYEKWLFK
ncbi:MAG: coenzyme F420-0:L-glutamate ligase [Thermoproteota archaeon]|nr:coenzyme F420-0:L-glutamate ligase [Thermoproteota archaeon]